MMGKMALSTSALRHSDGSRRWAQGSGVSKPWGWGEGRGSRQVKADRESFRDKTHKSIPDCVVNMQAAHNSC